MKEIKSNKKEKVRTLEMNSITIQENEKILKVDKKRVPILFTSKEKIDYLKISVYPIENGYIVKIIYGEEGAKELQAKDYSCKTHEEVETLLLEVVPHLI